MSPAKLTVLITLQMTGFSIQYYVLTLFITQLNGNKFVNSVIFGMTRAVAILTFGSIMSRMEDMTVFKIVFVGTLLSNIVLICFPNSNEYLIYAANCLFVACLGGW